MALSTGASWMGQRKGDSNRNENPVKEDWEERITEDFKRLKISSRSERDQGEDDEEESSTFFTANSSPSAAVCEVFLPSDPWPADPLSPDTAAGSSTADATVTGTLVSSTPAAAPHSPIGRAAPTLAGSLVTPFRPRCIPRGRARRSLIRSPSFGYPPEPPPRQASESQHQAHPSSIADSPRNSTKSTRCGSLCASPTRPRSGVNRARVTASRYPRSMDWGTVLESRVPVCLM
ncbi:hypothetical protein DFP72DRAFT_482908 [Ephemerocybe angulata]|uniref:Uncharacterized protein n=1 Tax=Ephemerocybe angulata TaxID=980116 RepID=A0A8H6IGK0_9AGAR|nr:hypothetical protein DFP72DRAFT_482908 [Tulosesus angulatus]